MRIGLSIIMVFSASVLLAVADIDKQTTGSTGTNSPATTDEQRLLAAIPEIKWNQERFVSEGWMKPGQVVLPKMNRFSKKDFPRFGVNGEIGFLFERQRLFSFSFDIADGEVGTNIGNDDWIRLYKSVQTICTSPEKRSGDTKSSSVNWTIVGEIMEYDVKLTRRVFGATIERGLEILFKPIKK